MIAYQGKEYTIAGLAIHLGVPYSTLHKRISSGVAVDDLGKMQPRPIQKISFEGNEYTRDELASKLELTYKVLCVRLAAGWSDEELRLKYRNKRPTAKRGAKLDYYTAERVFIATLKGDRTLTAIAKEYHLDPSHVSDIAHGKKWPEFFKKLHKYLPEKSNESKRDAVPHS